MSEATIFDNLELDFADDSPEADAELSALFRSLFREADPEIEARYDALISEVNDVLDDLESQAESGEDVTYTVTFTAVEAHRALVSLGHYACEAGLQKDPAEAALDAAERLLTAIR